MFDHITYNRERAQARRIAWITEHGPCVECGSTSDLEVDHIDPATKSFTISFTEGKDRLDRELAKCQVLCHGCHLEKAITNKENRGGGQNRIDNPPHGTGACYASPCRCEDCRTWKRRYRAGLVDVRNNAVASG